MNIESPVTPFARTRVLLAADEEGGGMFRYRCVLAVKTPWKLKRSLSGHEQARHRIVSFVPSAELRTGVHLFTIDPPLATARLPHFRRRAVDYGWLEENSQLPAHAPD